MLWGGVWGGVVGWGRKGGLDWNGRMGWGAVGVVWGRALAKHLGKTKAETLPLETSHESPCLHPSVDVANCAVRTLQM